MYKVILIDDEQKIREGITNLFPWEQLGFELSASFSNGLEALEYLKGGNQVDVVMTDIQMPRMNGIDLSSALLDTNIKVVFFSSYQSFEYAKSAITNHVVDYLVKPIKYNDIVTCFEKIKASLDSEYQASSNVLTKDDLSDSYYGNIIQTVKKYVKEHYQDATLEEAAMLVSLSTSYLSKLFKQKTNENFSDYLIRIRMETAAAMIKNPAYKLYEIASLVGYDNPKNFTRTFKAYYQMPPQDYRRKYQPDAE